MNGTETPVGRVGAVLHSLGAPSPVALGKHGPYVVTTLAQAREVLTDPERFDFPMDVSRRSMAGRGAEAGPGRSPHSITPPLEHEAVERGRLVFGTELTAAFAARSVEGTSDAELDAMRLLRLPVARSTTAAVLPQLSTPDRDRVGDLVLDWIDSLGPIIARLHNPPRWSRLRRTESRCDQALQQALAGLGVADPPATATLLAAGIQVPIAAGAWLLVKLAEDPQVAEVVRARSDLARAVAWETLRLCPPTWITARITADDVVLGSTPLPAGTVVMVSPLLLGRIEALAPGPDAGAALLDRFDPCRWDQETLRPGSWLPFGAGPHACPGRNLGLAQLTHLAEWARAWSMTPVEPVEMDQSRGIFPNPARLRLTRARGVFDESQHHGAREQED